jgi:hypothetical protein
LNKKDGTRNEKELKEGKYAPMIRSAIAAAMKATRDREKFILLLRNSGIDAVFRTNDAGRLYGATFIDHNRKEVYNGSALGKEFSANVFHKLFNENGLTTDLQDNKTMLKTERESCQSFNQENHVSDIFGIFDFPFTSDSRDYIEQKIFHAQIIIDNEKVAREVKAYKSIPVITPFLYENGNDVMQQQIQRNCDRIKSEALQIKEKRRILLCSHKNLINLHFVLI